MTFISVDNVAVEFPIYSGDRNLRSIVLRGAVGGLLKREAHSTKSIVRALEGVSFHLEDGDRLGLIGHNGAGKTTLLQTLAGIYEPCSGYVKARGRISLLLTTNLGMDMDDTGAQNIATCGMLLGMSMKEIAKKQRDIEEFTDLNEFLHLPVRTYSSGMVMRLAFAITTSIEPDILLLDEGIGAGDAAFQAKAQQRIRDLMQRTKILVLASHAEGLIREMCNKALWLDHGRVRGFGPVDDIITEYNHAVNG